MFKAVCMMRHARRWVLGLGENNEDFVVFERYYGQLSTA